MDKEKRILFFASITFLFLIFESCRSAKYLDDDQALVAKVEINGVPAHLKEQASQYISNEIRPNSKLNLTIYNTFNTKNGRYKTDKIRQVGESPRILDSVLVELSGNQIQQFLQTKGYFNAHIKPEIFLRRKKAYLYFQVETGDHYIIQDKNIEFENKDLETIYQNEVSPQFQLKKGDVYDASKLSEEREQLYIAARNNGYYDFLRQYVRVGVDTNLNGNYANLLMKVRNADSTNLEQYRINQVTLHILSENKLKNPNLYIDSLRNLRFLDETANYKLRPIERYMFIRSGDMYSLKNENLAYDRLYEMNGFRAVKITYEKNDDNTLNVGYELTPRSLMANQVEGEYTFSSGMSGFNIGNTFSHRNVFGGSELLEVKLRYGVLFDPRLDGVLSDKIFNNDFQVGVNLVVPRLMTPFEVSSTGTYGLPRTTFSSSLQIFNQDKTYSNRYFINTLNYTWWQSRNLQHSYTPLVLEYRQGRFDPSFEQTLIDEGYRLYVESNNRQYFGLGSQYAVSWNAPKLQRLEDFSFFKGTIDLSGNSLGLLSNLFRFKKNQDGLNTLFGVTYLQYIKGEVDYRKYTYFGGNRQFVFRFNGGVAVPYGNNSELLIFEKSFFAGGMNGIRAWQARTLGPGNYNRENLPESLRLNLRNLDQLGEVKLEANFEYRFRLLDNFLGAKMNGASFVDMGNIWRLRENELNLNGEMKFDKLFSQIAIGTGFGLRFDMDYFTMRLDAGLKVKDPQFTGSNQWVVKHLFNAGEFKTNYFQTHRPDRYSLIQYNFGVGLPF